MKSAQLLVTFFLLWLLGYLNPEVQTGIAYFGILTIGLIHGANDLAILNKKAENKRKRRSFWSNMLLYAGCLLSVLLLFIWQPVWALPAFILISAYHFGEQHWKSQTELPKGLSGLLYMAYGGTVLFMIFLVEINGVQPLLYDILQIDIPVSLVQGCFYVFGAVFLLLLTYNALLAKNFKMIFLELFYLALLSVVVYESTLIMGFALYFVLWHSLPSIKDQMQFLYGSQEKEALVRYFKSSWPYWAVSLLGLFVFVFFFKDQHEFLETFLISFLAAVTFPHVVVMHRMEH